MSIEYWIFFGVLVSIVASTFLQPLRFSRLFFCMALGVIGSLVGGVFAYMIYGIKIQGIDVSMLLMAITAAVFFVAMRKRIEKFYFIMRGGDKDAGWSI